MFRNILWFLLVCFFSFNYWFPRNAFAKGSSPIVEEGIIFGYGYGRVYGGEHQKYRLFLNILHIGLNAHRILPSIIPDNGKRLIFYLEPQYNLVTNPCGNYEYGIGFGIEDRFKVISGVDVYLILGSGFHYISFSSNDQARGFNFNDNVGMGLYIFTTKESAINVGFRFRHVSNAGIVKPDAGINSYIFLIGYSIFM